MMQSHIHCICLTFLCDEFLCEFLDYANRRKHSRRGYICIFSLCCVLWHVSLNCRCVLLQIHIHYTSLAFLLCAFPCVLLICQFLGRQSRIDSIYLVSHHCATINVSSNDMPEWMNSHIDHICAAFLLYVFSYDLSNEFSDAMQSYIACICTICFQNVFSCVFSNCSN